MNRRTQETVKKYRRPLRPYEILLVVVTAILSWISILGPVKTAIEYTQTIQAETQWGDTFRIHLFSTSLHSDVGANVIYRGTYFWVNAGMHDSVEEAFQEPECLFQKNGYNVYRLYNSLICIKDGRIYASGWVRSVTLDWPLFAALHWDLRPKTTDETVLAELEEIRQECIDLGLAEESIGQIR